MTTAVEHFLKSSSDETTVFQAVVVHFVIPAQAGIQIKSNKMKNYFLYILASKRNGTLYIGITNDLRRRVFEHKEGLIEGFTKKYNVKMLVYYEIHLDIKFAIQREKQMKKWLRKWKIELIEKMNPEWNDLSKDLF
jgi:putative endonuclease